MFKQKKMVFKFNIKDKCFLSMKISVIFDFPKYIDN